MKEQKQIKKEHFANLLIVAYADGKLAKEEVNLLAQRAIDYGLSEEEIQQLVDNLDQLKFEIPYNQEEKEQQLTNAIYMSLIDGEIAQQEYKICLHLAQRLGLDQKYLDNLIELVKELWKNEQKSS